MFFKIGVLKNSQYLQEITYVMCLFNKVARLSDYAALLKRGSNADVFLRILQKIQEQLFS